MTILQRLALLAGLSIGGAQPVAVGLLPVPWDKVVHTTVFAATAFLLASARVSEHWGWLVASIFLPSRNCDWADFAADQLGATLGGIPYVFACSCVALGVSLLQDVRTRLA